MVQAAVGGLAIAVSFAACIDVDGGAIEAAWVINSVAGRGVRIDCDCARLGAIRFALSPVAGSGGDPCASGGCEFDCDRGVGTTKFSIAAGRYAISAVPLDLDGVVLTAQDGVRGPAAAVREVRAGELTDLGVSLFLVARGHLAAEPVCEADALEGG